MALQAFGSSLMLVVIMFAGEDIWRNTLALCFFQIFIIIAIAFSPFLFEVL
jgi:hypothetical protein